jgi:hypothetical protein
VAKRSVTELVEILYKSENDVWRDDAAQDLASASNHAEAEVALLEAIESPALDDSLRRTCAESLATLWINQGHVQDHILAKLHGMPRDVIEAFLLAAEIDFKGPKGA